MKRNGTQIETWKRSITPKISRNASNKVSLYRRLSKNKSSRYRSKSPLGVSMLESYTALNIQPSTSFQSINNLKALKFSSPHNLRRYKNICYKTPQENDQIKSCLSRYTQLSLRKSEETVHYSVSHKELRSRFINLASQINILLDNERIIDHLQPGNNERISMEAGCVCYLKIFVKAQPTPCKFRFEILKGSGNILVFFSQRISRPNAENCDKQILLKGKEVCISYLSADEKLKIFSDNFIYVKIQALQYTLLYFQYIFGYSTFKQKESNSNSEDVQEKTEVPIKDLKSLPFSEIIKMCQIRPKTRAAKQNHEMHIWDKKRSLSPVDVIYNTKFSYIKNKYEHRLKNVKFMREQREIEEIQKKFVFSHKKTINEIFEKLLQTALFKKEQNIKRMQIWVAFIKLMNSTKLIQKHFNITLKEHQIHQKRRYAVLRIQVIIRKKLKEIHNNINQRIIMRLNSSNFIFLNIINQTAISRAQTIFVSLLQQHETLYKIRTKCFQYISQARKIQIQWKKSKTLEKIRKNIVRKMWEKAINYLIQINQNKSKKQQQLVRKLKILPIEIIQLAIDKYFLNIKKENL